MIIKLKDNLMFKYNPNIISHKIKNINFNKIINHYQINYNY